MGWYGFGPYVPVAEKRAKAEKLIQKLKKSRPDLQPVCPEGRSISESFWGKAWCKHLETCADFDNRIGRGRSYVRNRAVCHLEAAAGRLSALVCGSEGAPYEVTVTVKPLPEPKWTAIKAASAGHIGSMLDLLRGKFPREIMARVSDPEKGLFPRLEELDFDCSCPDWAHMCKHVAAALFAFGHRLDQSPELLFLLRGVDPAELINLESQAEAAVGRASAALKDESLSALFGIEMDLGGPETAAPAAPRARGRKAAAKAAPEPSAPEPSADEAAAPVRAGRKKAGAAPTTPPVKAAAPPPDKPAVSAAFKNPARPGGKEIRTLRLRLRMSQTKFADAVGVSLAAVGRWEKTRYPEMRRGSRARLLALAEERLPALPATAPKALRRRAGRAQPEPQAAQSEPPVKISGFKNPDRPKGSEIELLRLRLKMSRSEFAAALGVTLITVGRWETLKYPELRRKSKERLLALARQRKRGR